MSILGLDYGSKTVGVAVTDNLMLTTQPLETITRERETQIRPTLRRIGEIIAERGITEIVLGLPLYKSGDDSERSEKTREFAELLSNRFSIPVSFQDERYSTVEAAEILKESGVKKKDEKKYVDQVAAAIILEDYLRAKGLMN